MPPHAGPMPKYCSGGMLWSHVVSSMPSFHVRLSFPVAVTAYSGVRTEPVFSAYRGALVTQAITGAQLLALTDTLAPPSHTALIAPSTTSRESALV